MLGVAACALGLIVLGLSSVRATESDGPSIDPGGVRYRDRVFSELDAARDVVFAEVTGVAGDETLRMDVFWPRADDVTDRPIFIVAFGGGYRIGSRGSVEALARDFAHRGYVAATIDYRLTDHEPWTEEDLVLASVRASHDGFAALRFLRERAGQWGVRTDAAVMGGVSAGGFLASMNGTLDEGGAGLHPEALAYYATHGGLTGDTAGGAAELSEVQGILNLSGGLFDLDSIDPGDAVMYAVHDEFDPIVPCGSSTDDPWGIGATLHGSCAVIERYRELGIPHGFTLHEGSDGHATFSQDQIAEITDAAALFFFDEVVQP